MGSQLGWLQCARLVFFVLVALDLKRLLKRNVDGGLDVPDGVLFANFFVSLGLVEVARGLQLLLFDFFDGGLRLDVDRLGFLVDAMNVHVD